MPAHDTANYWPFDPGELVIGEIEVRKVKV
jgi:hypothetical protein